MLDFTFSAFFTDVFFFMAIFFYNLLPWKRLSFKNFAKTAVGTEAVIHNKI
jgi:hypothetical protein